MELVFESADKILEQGMNHSLHIIDYFWSGFEPHLIAYDQIKGRLEEIELDKLGMIVSEEKGCVGSFEDGIYRPCPYRVKIKVFSQCKRCAGAWVPVQKCIFEPQCNGDMCGHPEFCRRPHVVYLAFYGDLVKVGMTSEKRLMERAIEQGADAVAPVLKCNGRSEARSLEREISSRFKIPQEIRAKKVLSRWVSRPQRELIIDNYASCLSMISAFIQVIEDKLQFLDQYPINEFPVSTPVIDVLPGMHFGEVIGVKGRFMMFKKGKSGDVHAIDLRGLVGRWAILFPSDPARSPDKSQLQA